MVLPFWLAAIVVGINLLLLPYLGLILVPPWPRFTPAGSRASRTLPGRDFWS